MKTVFNKFRFYSDVASIPPLNVPLPGDASGQVVKNGSVTSSSSRVGNEVQVTILSNGVKVASEESFGPFCTLGGINQILRSLDYDNLSYAFRLGL